MRFCGTESVAAGETQAATMTGETDTIFLETEVVPAEEESRPSSLF